jgi:hypothetical protein
MRLLIKGMECSKEGEIWIAGPGTSQQACPVLETGKGEDNTADGRFSAT